MENKMMIFDADTHLAPMSDINTYVPVEEMIRKMDRNGISKALSWAYPPYVKTDLPETVTYVAEAMQKYPDRIYGFGWIDPRLGMENAIALTKQCLNSWGMYGVKINGSQNKHYIDDEQLVFPIVEETAKAGKLIAFHTGSDDIDHCSPYRMRKVMKAFPDARFLMIHMGGTGYRAAIEVAKECPNVTLVGSEVPKQGVLDAIRELGSDRVAFGSDTPFCHTAAEVGAYRYMLSAEQISEEDQKNIMFNNIARLIGVPTI